VVDSHATSNLAISNEKTGLKLQVSLFIVGIVKF